MTSLAEFNKQHNVSAQLYSPTQQVVAQVDHNVELQRQEQSLVQGQNPLLYYILFVDSVSASARKQPGSEIGRGVLQRNNKVQSKCISQQPGDGCICCYCCVTVEFDAFIRDGNLNIHYENQSSGPVTQTMLIDKPTHLPIKTSCFYTCFPSGACFCPSTKLDAHLRVFTKPF